MKRSKVPVARGFGSLSDTVTSGEALKWCVFASAGD
jgi:hypothetical protein